MPGSDHYHTMTDEQIAEWHQLTTKCDRLQAAVDAADVHLERVVRQALAHESTLRGRISALETDLLKSSSHRAELQTAIRNHAAAQVETLRALRRLLAALKQAEQMDGLPEAQKVVSKIANEAAAVVAKYDVPFA
jgi:small-conductance mechanosensitive channel